MSEVTKISGKVEVIDRRGRTFVSLDDLLILFMKAKGSVANLDALIASLERLKSCD